MKNCFFLMLFSIVLFSCTATIHESARDGDINAVKSYVATGNNINHKVDSGVYMNSDAGEISPGMTPLQVAVDAGQYEVVRYLVESGADLKVLTNSGNNLLMMGLRRPDIRITSLLISKGVEVNHRNILHEDPLRLHCRFGNVEVSRLLISNGADINTAGFTGKSLLVEASQARKNSHKMIDLLLDSGIKIDSIDSNGLQVIHYAGPGVLDYLLDKGADINARSVYGVTPFIWRAGQRNSFDYKEALKLLASRGANINAVTNDGSNALHLAAFSGSAEGIKIISSMGINPNLSDKNGNTPLHIAYKEKRDKEVVNALLQAGANPYVKNKSGKKPFEMKP